MFEKKFALRAVVCYFLVLLMLLVSVLRVTAINLKNYSYLQSVSNGITIEIATARGSILDTNGIPLTNSKMQNVAAIMPTPSAISAVKAMKNSDEKTRVLKLLLSGRPAVIITDTKLECDGISCINIPVRITENTVAHHIVGYLDGNFHGADGIEAAYDDLLSAKSPITAVFPSNGNGKPLLGLSPEFTGDTDSLSNAVYLTLDINIQKAVEEASAGLLSGAVVVSESKTNKIRAMVSLPDFLPDDIAQSLGGENSPLLNKCLTAYNVGSAFKPCIAAAAVKDGMDNTVYECDGKRIIEGRIFNCHNMGGHGLMDMTGALKYSCNCYFYDLAIALGSKSVVNSAEYLNFGSKIKLAENIYTASGNIPSYEELSSDSAVANFGIGQGDIMLSPVCMLDLYSAIANGGEYCLPSIVEKTVSGGKEEIYDNGHKTTAMSKTAAELIKNALKKVVNEGTGKAAYSEKVTSAGKTATAQTGRVDENGNEITNSWFCGFFPADDPVYTVIIMCDGVYDKSPAAVFKDISEILTK